MDEARLILIPYAPRRQFLAFHERTARWAVMVCHRRAGKTVAAINELLRAALSTKAESARFGYIAPTFTAAKDIAWQYVRKYSAVVPGAEFNEAELRADYPNGARIRLYGADNPDRLRGVYFDGVVLDEYADMRPRVWGEVVRPTLSDRKGWAAFIGTPRGKNELWQIWEQAQEDTEWFYYKLKASESNLLDAEELRSARKMMSEDEYEQEYECSFEAAIRGAVYGRELKQAEADNRITGVPYDPKAAVTTAWDLGIGDATAIWCAQTVGREVRIIDYYEASGAGLDHYVGWLRSKPYAYATHILPHDVEVRELGTGVSRIEILRSLGLYNLTVLPLRKPEEGHQAARAFIPRCWWDKTKCKDGIEALRQYQYEWDDERRTFARKARHDWTSHAADAFRYLATGYKDTIAARMEPLKYPSLGIS